MITYTERWGELWEQFIREKYVKYNLRGSIRINKVELLHLDEEFQKWLFEKNSSLGIAG